MSHRNHLLDVEQNERSANIDETMDMISGVKVCGDTNDNQQVSSVLSSLSTSCSRTSLLLNGRTVYFVSPLQTTDEPIISRRSSIRHVDIDSIENPPNYEDALLNCRPLHLNFSPLRRSITDRDFIKRITSHIRRPWGSSQDLHEEQRLGDETQL